MKKALPFLSLAQFALFGILGYLWFNQIISFEAMAFTQAGLGALFVIGFVWWSKKNNLTAFKPEITPLETATSGIILQREEAFTLVRKSGVMMKILGIALICWGGGLIYMVTDFQIIPSFDLFKDYSFGIFLFGIALILLGLKFLFPTKNVVTFGFEIDYNPLTYAFRSLKNSVIFGIVSFAMTFLFFQVALDDKIAYFGVALAGIFFLSILWGFGIGIKNLIFDIKYGKTKFIANQVIYHFGDTINFQIQNHKLPSATYKYTLRNISDGWEETHSGSKTTVSHVFRTFFEEQKETNMLSSMNFKIPAKSVNLQATNLDSTIVYYWEIEVSSKEINYFSRFVLNVQ